MQAEEWIGRTINSYVIERVIKSGGMGIILAAKHRFLDEKPVAIKIIHPDRQHDADMANRLLREANAAKSIRHPGVVEILDFGETPDGDVFLIMELCIGQDLGASLGKDGTFGEGKVARLGALIADALDATHRGGVIHRDLKPSNIMLLDGDENVKIVDFGIARFTAPGQTLTTAGAVMGTPDYMAPEQALGRAVDARTDIYAFGVILFELLTDRRPFVTDPGSELVSLLVKHITEPPPPPSQYVQVSPAMQALILQCL